MVGVELKGAFRGETKRSLRSGKEYFGLNSKVNLIKLRFWCLSIYKSILSI
jgi:hypothetical protein